MTASQDNNPKSYRFKIILIGVLFVLFFSIVILRAYHLQIRGSSKLNNLAQSQYNAKLIISPRRGAIYDRNGEVLAIDVLVSSVGIHPHRIPKTPEIKQFLSKQTGVSLNELEKKLNSAKKFEWLQRRITAAAGKIIEDKKITGVQVVSEYRRYYPNKDLAGQVLGAVGYDARALGGIEYSYNKYLMSDSQKKQVERDARGKFFSRLTESDDVHDLYLTLDKNIQFLAEEVLVEFAEKHKAQSGFAIVGDVDTGEILAMANYPRFNPNLYWKHDQSKWKNHAVIDEYEPGSTFKTITMTAALRSGKVKLDDKFYCEGGSYRVGNAIVNDHNPYGWLDARSILRVSSNIGATKIAQKIGRETFYKTIRDLGFGALSGLDLPGEPPGYVRSNYKAWRDIEFSNMSFGQGLSVNGIQMMMAYSAIANGGTLHKPLLLKKIVDAKGNTVVENSVETVREILKSKDSRDLLDVLHTVTQPGGTAGQAHVEGYLAGGKTGTAQKFDNKTKTYATGQYLGSFIGFVPLNKPKFLIYVLLDTPTQNGYYGGVVAAPAFQKLAQKVLSYAGLIPADKVTSQKIATEDTKSKKIKKTEQVSPPLVVSSQDFQQERQKRWESVLSQFKGKKVPDLTGLTMGEVLNLMQNYNIKFRINGSGYVVAQTPVAGSELSGQQEWQIRMGGLTDKHQLAINND